MKWKVVLLLLMIMGAGSLLSAQVVDEESDIQALYQQIDEAIDQSPQYVAKRLGEIAEAH